MLVHKPETDIEAEPPGRDPVVAPRSGEIAEAPSLTQSIINAGQLARERVFSFGVIYVGIVIFLLLYIFTVRAVESALDDEFQDIGNEAVAITRLDSPIAVQIQERIQRLITDSRWVKLGGVQVTILVLAQDGVTWLYVDGHVVPQPEGLDPTDVLKEAVALLPATADVTVTVPHNSLLANAILIAYAAILLQCLYLYNRTISGRERQRLEEALAARDAAARRSKQIEEELDATRQRLVKVEPAERENSEEINALVAERRALQAKLAALASREEELRGTAAQAHELSQEVSALEDLLEEASHDLLAKDEAIATLEKNLKRAARGGEAGGSSKRSRDSDLLSKRMRTLYKNLEVEDRAIHDMLGLGDESLRLKAEECLKRLSEEAENVAVRRKVGGLPEHLRIFELGFAGKGRIYYTRGQQVRFRVLCVGAKNTQDADLEYLRRWGKAERKV